MTVNPTKQRVPADHKQHLGLVFAGLMLSMLLASLSQMVLSTALPTMVGELNGADHIMWVITAYILASTIAMPIYGKLGDLLGRKNLLVAAITIFVGGSIIGGMAPDMNWLIAGRTIQGLGGGGLIILSQAVIADLVPARDRGKYMGIMGGVFAVSSVAGPLLGGWFTEDIGWRWTFWINLPLGALALAATIFLLHLPVGSTKNPKLDFAGMALLSTATASLVLVATWGGHTYAWTSPTIIALMVLTLVAGLAFVRTEARADEPIIPLHLFRERNFNLTTISGLFVGIAMFGAMGYLPTYLQMATGASATVAGLLMVPMMGSMLIVSVISGMYVSRTGTYKWLPIAGSLALALAMVLLSTMTIDTPVWLICSYIAVMGIGLGASMQILVLIVQNTFHVREVGTATAANNYFRQVGASLGSAVVGSVFAARLTTLLTERLPQGGTTGDANSLTPDSVKQLPDALRLPIVESYNDALAPIFLYIAPLAIIAAILLCFLRVVPLATTIERDIPAESLAEGQPVVPPESDESEGFDQLGAVDAAARDEPMATVKHP
jgi:EmrB/QacA subfamily drug resistance transporter